LIWAGSSGVGSIAIQLAKYAGCWVATTASNNQKADELRRIGADMVVNHKEQNVGQVIRDTGAVNLVIELVSTTLQASIDACLNDGRIVLIGNLGGQQATVDTQIWRLKRINVIGGGVYHTSTENEQRVLQLVADKSIHPIIARTMPIEKAAEAHRILPCLSRNFREDRACAFVVIAIRTNFETRDFTKTIVALHHKVVA
jgi:NADPH:quinone reductase-like Zn-dependent oxidoreductase